MSAWDPRAHFDYKLFKWNSTFLFLLQYNDQAEFIHDSYSDYEGYIHVFPFLSSNYQIIIK